MIRLMRTTLNIEDDVLFAVKQLTPSSGTPGRVTRTLDLRGPLHPSTPAHAMIFSAVNSALFYQNGRSSFSAWVSSRGGVTERSGGIG
jgi:hypothetical protein